jgi:hypothetical protein
MHKEEEKISTEFRKWDNSNPFKTPEGYFESFEDKVMSKIKFNTKPHKTSTKVIRMLKPILSLAASFVLVILLVQYPIKRFLKNDTVVSEQENLINNNSFDLYSISLSMVDDHTLINSLFSDDKSNDYNIDPDEMFSYLSSRLNEVEIYSDFQN